MSKGINHQNTLVQACLKLGSYVIKEHGFSSKLSYMFFGSVLITSFAQVNFVFNVCEES